MAAAAPDPLQGNPIAAARMPAAARVQRGTMSLVKPNEARKNRRPRKRLVLSEKIVVVQLLGHIMPLTTLVQYQSKQSKAATTVEAVANDEVNKIESPRMLLQR